MIPRTIFLPKKKNNLLEKYILFFKNRNKSIGALGLIRKCLMSSPSERYTIDDIAAHWWVNVGYKYPPVYYYDALVMQRTSTTTSSHPPSASKTNGTTKTESTTSEQKPKPAYTYARPFPPSSLPPPPRAPPLLVQNGHLTDTELKSPVKTNGYHQIMRSHRLNGTPTIITNNNINEIYKSNQPNRWISNDKPNGGLPSIRQPLPRTTVY